MDELPKDREIAAYCQVGQRGYLATRILNQSGFDAVNLSGGYKTYKLWNPQLHAGENDRSRTRSSVAASENEGAQSIA
jgi:predicted sulfurtransferase